MNDTKFTPGPWRRDEHHVKLGDRLICFAAYPREMPDEHQNRQDGESWLDARIRLAPERAAIVAESEANAALIAAAPDLYSALASIVAAHEECDTMGIGYVLADAARTALAKARGES